MSALTEEQATVVIQFFNRFGDAIRRAVEQLSKVMKQWFPAISQAHRARVKSVHTEYHRRQKARLRRRKH